MGRFPVGGITWSYLQYIVGFQRLGYEVFYLEDTGECGYDPIANQISKDPSYAIHYIHQQLKTIGLENSWAYIDHMRPISRKNQGAGFSDMSPIGLDGQCIRRLLVRSTRV